MDNAEHPKPAEPTAVVKQIAVTGNAGTLKPAEPTFVQKWKIYLYPGLVWGGVALAWIVFVACKVNWREMAQIGQFGDAMAPVALFGAALGLILTAVSVRVQSEDFKAQLEEMKDATRFQSRREVYDSIERLVDRINDHRRAVTNLLVEKNLEQWVDSYYEDAKQKAAADPTGFDAYAVQVVDLYKDAVEQGDHYQRQLAAIEAVLFAFTDDDSIETRDDRQDRQDVMAEVVVWHANRRRKYLELSEPGAFRSSR